MFAFFERPRGRIHAPAIVERTRLQNAGAKKMTRAGRNEMRNDTRRACRLAE